MTSGASKLRVVALGDGLEKIFWAHVNQDPLDFHFFVYDWTFKRAQTRIFMALDEWDAVAGLMVVYLGCLVQVRGTCEAVRLLLEGLDVTGVTVQVPLDCADIVAGKFPIVEQKATVVFLALRKGEEKIDVTSETERLRIGDAVKLPNLCAMRILNFGAKQRLKTSKNHLRMPYGLESDAKGSLRRLVRRFQHVLLAMWHG